jgi:hypothetical protein
LAIAAQAYLALVTPLNAQDDALVKGVCKSFTTNPQWRACYSKLVPIDQKFLTGVYAITFPASMKSDVDALITDETKLLSYDTTLAEEASPNLDTTTYNAESAISTAGSAASGIVRHDLGLPPI